MMLPDSSGGNPLFLWAELEPEEGQYDWSALDAALAGGAANGQTIVPRILTNADLFGQATPNWFFNTPGAQSYYPSLEAQTQQMRAPVPWDPVFKRKFGAFLAALGERYNGNPGIEFFQTNAGGGLYGEIVLTGSDMYPGGTNADIQKKTIRYWLDRWIEAFPDTRLSLMVNEVGYNIAESAAAYAASRGVYLQQNSPWLSPAAVALFTANQRKTGIVLEVEDAGCQSATGPAFDQMTQIIFAYGFPIDYLSLCGQSFEDPSTFERIPAVIDRLRVH
jgi:hypothetical protein